MMMKSVLFLLFVVFATNVKTEGEEQASDKGFKCYYGNDKNLNGEILDCNTAKGEVCFKASALRAGDNTKSQHCRPQKDIHIYKDVFRNFETCNTDYCNKM